MERVMMENERLFYKKLEMYSKLVLLYEDCSLQQFALKHVPVEELTSKASKDTSCTKTLITEDELLIIELLKWYKLNFFSWVDHPLCETCGSVTERRGFTDPVVSELLWNATIVEKYFCSFCKNDVRFPRYNHPKKLLETRKGRCGEWANCFTLLCRALQYDARLVIEWGDHVWTEIFIPSQNKWVHCDPCESSFDSPLMYENGWGKKISYVIAFSKDEVQDVTWRYSRHHSEVLQRRILCRETWLLNRCTFLTERLQATLSAKQKEVVLHRKVSELAQFFCQCDVKENELKGRTSGSLSWRLERGECTSNATGNLVANQLNEHEIKARKFHLRYCCASDKYIKVLDSSEFSNWNSLIFAQSNVFRKVEHDWNMVYLARHKGSISGYITWKFNFQTSGLKIESINLLLMCKTFGSGSVKWKLASEKKEISIPDGQHITCTEFQGFDEFSLTAHLSGGDGPVAWQHAQLFRQPLDSTDCPFEIVVKFITT